jgi:hypothetical protein
MKVYNTNFVATYNLINYKNKSLDEESDILFRSQYLQAFNLEDWDNDIISDLTNSLYVDLEIQKNFSEIFKYIRNNQTIFSQIMLFYSEIYEDIDLFKLLFLYDTFYLIHKYICDRNNNKIHNQKIINSILDKIKQPQ